MLSYDQAVYFLEGILRMPSTWRNLLVENPLEFLTLYLKRHAIRVPFQNMHMASVEEGHRWFPSEEQLISNGLSGRGGCCIHLNYFTKLVFQSLGLDSFVVRGDHYCAPIAGTHCLVMVRLHGAKNPGLYMIEVGGAYPVLEPIPMDKEKLPYRTLQAGGFPYEYREIAPGWVAKFHLEGGLLGGKFTDKKETQRTCWELKPRGLWEFDYPMLETFTKPSYSILLRAPFSYRFFSNVEFRKLFPELPENAGAKEKVLVTKSKPLSQIGKVLAATGRPKVKSVAEATTDAGLIQVTNGKANNKIPPARNGKASQNGSANNKDSTLNERSLTKDGKNVSNGKDTKKGTNGVSTITTGAVQGTNGKASLEMTLSKMEIEESDEDEFEVVTEEEIESEEEDDDLENPQNFVLAFKRRIVVGDAKNRKIVKNYETYAEMAADFKKYFPKVPSKVVDKAFETFSTYPSGEESAYDKIL